MMHSGQSACRHSLKSVSLVRSAQNKLISRTTRHRSADANGRISHSPLGAERWTVGARAIGVGPSCLLDQFPPHTASPRPGIRCRGSFSSMTWAHTDDQSAFVGFTEDQAKPSTRQPGKQLEKIDANVKNIIILLNTWSGECLVSNDDAELTHQVYCTSAWTVVGPSRR